MLCALHFHPIWINLQIAESIGIGATHMHIAIADVIEGDRAIIYSNNKVLTQQTIVTSLLAHNPFMKREEIDEVIAGLFDAREESLIAS